MKCDKCGEREASVSYKQSINGEMTSMNLCHECAHKMGVGSFFTAAPFPFEGGLFGNLLGISGEARGSKKTCEGCGASFADIRREGKVCCPLCYHSFAAELEPTLRSLHGKAVHVGRGPQAYQQKKEKTDRKKQLREQLQEAIAAERYEDAAALRDELKALEKEDA